MLQEKSIHTLKGVADVNSKNISPLNQDYMMANQLENSPINSFHQQKPLVDLKIRNNQIPRPAAQEFKINGIETPQDSNSGLDTKGSIQTKYLSNLAANKFEQNRPQTSSRRQIVKIQSKNQLSSKEHLKTNKSVGQTNMTHPRSAYSSKTTNIYFKQSSASNFAEMQIQKDVMKPHDIANQARQTSSKDFLIETRTKKHISGYHHLKEQASYQFGSQIF